MATFGKVTTGGQNDEAFNGFKYVSKYTLGVEGWATKLTLDCDGLGSGSGATTIRAVIYADSGGVPGALVGTGTAVVVADSAVRAWVDLPFGAAVHLPAGDYWLGFVDDNLSSSLRYWAAFASGHGKNKSGGVTDPFGSGTTIDEDVAVYATYTTSPPAPTIAITAPANSSVASNLATVTVTPPAIAYHHIQVEYSLDGGGTWHELCAEMKTSLSAYFNTKRFHTGGFSPICKLRAKAYYDASSISLIETSAEIEITFGNTTTGSITYTGGTDTLSAAITAATAGDTIILDGDFPDEGSTVHVNKNNLTFRSLDPDNPAIIRSRVIVDNDCVSFRDISFRDNGARLSPEAHGKGTWFSHCTVSNSQSGIGIIDGGTIPFDADGAFDTFWENCTVFDIGDPSTEANSSHGIYAQNSTRLFIQNCLFYSCAARCIQLYPSANEATVDKTTAYGCEMAVNVGGDTSSGAGMGDANPARVFKTNHATIKRSIMGMTGGFDRGNSAGIIYAFWGHSVGAGTDNYACKNFLHDAPLSGFGVGWYVDTRDGGLSDAGNNTTGGNPSFVDAAHDDFRLNFGSAAIGFGPDWLQPSFAGTLGGIGSDEQFAPLLPETGLLPHLGLVPTESGASWAWAADTDSIPPEETWGDPLGGGSYLGQLGPIPPEEAWDSPARLAPHVGLYPHVGLWPQTSSRSYVIIPLPGESILSEEFWPGVLSVSVQTARIYQMVSMPTAIRTLVELTR